MKALWLGTACFLVDFDDVRIMLDPYYRRPPMAQPQFNPNIEEISKARGIFISHGHFDHVLDLKEAAEASSAPIVAPNCTVDSFLEIGVPKTQLHRVTETTQIDIGPVKATVIPSRHIKFDGITLRGGFSRTFGQKMFFKLLPLIRQFHEGETSIYYFKTPKESLMHVGSGTFDPDKFPKDIKVDVMFAPVAGREDMFSSLAPLIQAARPKTVVLSHFDDFYPPISSFYFLADFLGPARAEFPDINFVVPETGTFFKVPV